MPHTKENRNVPSIPDSLGVCARGRGKKHKYANCHFCFTCFDKNYTTVKILIILK